MKRVALFAAALALFLVDLEPVRAGVVTISASGRGWIDRDIDGSSFANGNTPGNFYTAGSLAFDLERNHFDFAIPVLSGKLISATLTLDNSSPPGHVGPTSIFSVSSLGAYGTYGFDDIGAGTPYGSASISGRGTVTITLNAAALAAIVANQGKTFSLGGVNSGESVYANYDFGFTRSATDNQTILTLETAIVPAAVPEPSTIALLGIGIVSIAGYRRRRHGQARG